LKDVDIETAVPGHHLTAGFRRRLAVLVGIAAVSASVLSWVESDGGRREDKARVDASRLGLDVFVRVAATQPRQQFELDALRRVTLTEGLGQVRVSAASTDDLVAFTSALGLSQVDNATARRLIALGRATTTLPDDPEGVDEAAFEALATRDQKQIDAVTNAQDEELEKADSMGTRQERAILGVGLVAIAASLLGLAGLMGEGRGGRLSLLSATVALVVANAWGLSGLL
jgi:hypothetical protein